MGVGLGQIIILFLVVLLFFGAKRLPEVARALGRASHEFHDAKNDALSPSGDDRDAETARVKQKRGKKKPKKKNKKS